MDWMDTMKKKKKLQSNEEDRRMDDNSPLVNTNQASGMQNMSHLNQSNSGQDANSLNNNLQNCFNQQTDIKPGTEATSIDSNLSGPRSTPGGLSDQMPHLVIDSMQHRNQIAQNATVNHNPFLKPKSISLDTTVAQKGKVSQKVFDPLEFEQALIPVVKKLYKQEPEALPFRQPVDPEEIPVFDLCENCYKEIGHEHKMDKMGLGIDDGTAPEAAVRAAKQAQQLVDQQDTESKKYMLTSNRNQMSTRPMPSNPRQVGPTWGQIQRPPVQMKIAGKYQPLIGGVPQQSVATSSNQTLKLVVDLLKIEGRGAPRSSEQLMALLKTNPQLISTLIRQRKKAAHTQQPQQKPQQFIKQSGMTSLGNVTMAGGVGVQQVPMQSSNNQPGMNMPVQVNNMSNMQPIHWQQQQQQQQRRMQLPHQNQQGQFQTPAPPYPQATRMMNVRFMQHRMQTPVRHQMNPNLVMQQGMNPSMSNMQQGLQSPMQHHTQQRPPSQPMQAGRLSQMSPHAMAGRTPPLNQNQGTVPQHMISTMDQQYNTVNSQPTLMGGGYPHQGVGQTMNFNNQTGTGFTTNVNQDLSHLGNAAPGQDNLERFVKISEK